MKNRNKLLNGLFAGVFFISSIFLYGCENEKRASTNSGTVDNISNYYSDSIKTKSVPLILYTYDSDQKVTAVKVEYDISAKKIKGESSDLFILASDNFGLSYQWDGKEKLYLPGENIYAKKQVLSKNITIESLTDYFTKVYEFNYITYKVYSYEKGIVLEKISANNIEKSNIDLLKDNPEIKTSTLPLLIFENNKKIHIILQYYHPSPILKNAMISGLMLVTIDGKKIITNKVDMKDKCCINPGTSATFIGNNYYLNTMNDLGKISISDNALEQVSFYENLTKEIKAEPFFKETDNQFDGQPLIGKMGDLLLLSYGTRTSTNSNYFLWGIHADKVVFKIKIKNNSIFDDAENKIGTTKNLIGRILLPNDLSN